MAAPIAQSASRNGGTHANQRSHAQPSDKILVSWEEFQTFVEKALISVRAKNVEYDAGRNRVRYTLEGLPPGKDFSIVSIKNLYEKKKFLDAETCSKSILAHFEETNDFSRGKQSIFQKNGLPENLYPTVQTHDFILCYNEGNRDPVSGEFTDTLIFRPFSAGSGEIYVGLVLGMERGEELLDGWIPSGCLKSWKLTDDGAFDLAVKNLDRITPAKLICKSFSRASELERAIEYSTSNITLLHDMVGVKPLEGRGSLSVIFSDQRALPRLLLPRVVEKLAEVLRCDATSLVVVPFEDGTFHAACGEDCQSMFKLSRHQFAPDAQGDSQHSKHKVTHSPFRVSVSLSLYETWYLCEDACACFRDSIRIR